MKVSSTNRNHHLGFRWKAFRTRLSKCSMKMLAMTKDKKDPVIAPSIYSWTTPLKLKNVEENHTLVRLRLQSLPI